jgi:sialic acid synthase SpsE
MGAAVVEKRLILDRSINALHSHQSLEPAEFKDWVARMRHAEATLGTPAIRPSAVDRAQSELYYRSICTLSPVRKGEKFTPDNLCGKRPGRGISTARLHEFWGRKAARDIAAETLLDDGDVA